MKIKNRKVKILLLVLFVLCFQLACTANKYRQPISKFQAASAVVSANSRKFYGESNRLNRTLEIKRMARFGQFIDPKKLKDVQFFDEKDLQARFDALDRLNEYVDLLVSIANSDAPENISKSATDLTGALGNLTNTVAGLGKGTDKLPNANFTKKTVDAFSLSGVIVSEVLKSFIQRKIRKGLEAAISRGAGPINELIDAIAADLRVVNQRYFDNLESESFILREIYDCEANKIINDAKKKKGCVESDIPIVSQSVNTPFSQQTLNSYRDQFIAMEDILETMSAANPTESLDKMKKAHIKIVTLANSDSPANFAEAVAAIEDFATAAKRLGDAVEKLKNS